MEPVSEESGGFVPEGAAPGPALAKSKGLLRTQKRRASRGLDTRRGCSEPESKGLLRTRKRRAIRGLDTRRGCSEPSIPRLCLNRRGFPVPLNVEPNSFGALVGASPFSGCLLALNHCTAATLSLSPSLVDFSDTCTAATHWQSFHAFIAATKRQSSWDGRCSGSTAEDPC
jgi:hypothetical protein